MATSGQVNTNTTYESYFWVKWEQVGNQDIPNNRTQIKWTCGLYSEHKFYSNAVKMSAFSINGTQVYSGGTYSNFTAEGNQQIASGTLWIGHNADGAKTFTISSFTGWLYSNHNYSSNGASYSLTTIPRQATITAAADFTDTGIPSHTFSNPGNFPLDVWLEPNLDAVHLCIRRDISGTNGTYKWDLTEEERDQLRRKCAGAECTLRYGLHTTIGNMVYSDYEDKKFTMTENDATKPTVRMSANLNNGTLPSTFDGLYIQGKSKVDVALSADGKYNATIKSYSAQIDGKTYNSDKFTSDVIQKTGSVDIIGYAKDSREITGSAKQTVNVIEYSKPLVIPLGSENAIQCYRSDGNGNRTGNSTSLWIKAKRFYYDVAGKNKCTLDFRWKKVSEMWRDDHEWFDLIPANTATDEYNALVPAVFDLKEAYTIQVRAIDTIGEYDIKTFEIPTQDVALHLGKGGKNVSIGTYCDYSEENTFYSDWKAIFDKDVIIRGLPVLDYVVEEDTEGIWTYRKWASGIAECWGTSESVTVTINTEWGSMFSYDNAIPNYVYPFTFASMPVLNITPHKTGVTNFWLFTGDGASVTQTPTVSLVRPTQMEVVATVDYYAIGRWK